MSEIHKTAIVSKKAEIGENVKIGPYSIINDFVIIGNGVEIQNSVYVDSGVKIGNNCKISVGAVLGTQPQDTKYKGATTKVEIGENTIIREYATINRGTEHGGGITRIGKGCYIMAYSHIAHDCILGNEVVMANVATLAGHVVIEDYAVVGGLTPVHQFVRIGKYAFIGGASRVPMDVLPFVRAAGIPLKIIGLNLIGLKRRGFTSERLQILEKIFRLLLRSGYNTSKAVEKIKENITLNEDVENVLNFIKNSKRGITRRL
ncbi:MAG: acyl-ACP--UDP-N-acetylglucosamine O-acyltransferase [Candidatus Hydrogenedentota bacterium]